MARSRLPGKRVAAMDRRHEQARLAVMMTLVVGCAACTVAHPPCAPEDERCHSALAGPI